MDSRLSSSQKRICHELLRRGSVSKQASLGNDGAGFLHVLHMNDCEMRLFASAFDGNYGIE